MGFDYARVRATAEKQIYHFGQGATLRRIVPGSGPNPGAPTVTDYPCQIVVTNYSQYNVDGTLVKAGDRKVLMSTKGLSVEPQVNDRLIVGIHTYTLVNVDPLSPGGVNVLFTVQARR